MCMKTIVCVAVEWMQNVAELIDSDTMVSVAFSLRVSEYQQLVRATCVAG
jgi:hypothetical protein